MKLCAILLLLLWVSCGFGGNTMVVHKGHPVFNITLVSNPTTGFSWKLYRYNPKAIQLVSHHFQPAASQLMGAPGQEIWTFNVKKSAFNKIKHTVIVMRYARPWTKEYATLRTFKIQLKQ